MCVTALVRRSLTTLCRLKRVVPTLMTTLRRSTANRATASRAPTKQRVVERADGELSVLVEIDGKHYLLTPNLRLNSHDTT